MMRREGCVYFRIAYKMVKPKQFVEKQRGRQRITFESRRDRQ
jgi:hypothetical protein